MQLIGAEEMPSVKYCPGRQEDFSLDSQTHVKVEHRGTFGTPVLGDRDEEIPLAWPVSLGNQ